MGLIKAGITAVKGNLADQWKEFFYCDSLDSDILLVRGKKKTSSKSSNKKGHENIISNGSGIAVADGQCMIIVEQGKIIDVCSEPGTYTFDSTLEPSIFAGNLEDGIQATFENIKKRFTYGGDTGTDQRIYYINTKEIVDNKYGTPNPVPFRVVDKNIGLDIDISVRCNGIYSFKIIDPILFYTNVTGNVEEDFRKIDIESQLKSELLTALQPAFSKISDMGIRYSSLPGHTMELANVLNEVLSKKWTELRGLKIISFGVNSVIANKEDEEMIKQLQRTAVMRDPNMAAANLTSAQADAMKAAGANSAGAMTGFMGLGMAQNAGGINAQSLYEMGAAQKQNQQQNNINIDVEKKAQDSWNCNCGNIAAGKFCTECGEKRPQDGWTCPNCSNVNKGKFCSECGEKKPADDLLYKCDKCGWEPEDPSKPPKFCPECGDIFNENDAK